MQAKRWESLGPPEDIENAVCEQYVVETHSCVPLFLTSLVLHSLWTMLVLYFAVVVFTCILCSSLSWRNIFRPGPSVTRGLWPLGRLNTAWALRRCTGRCRVKTHLCWWLLKTVTDRHESSFDIATRFKIWVYHCPSKTLEKTSLQSVFHTYVISFGKETKMWS